jgi:hypothetical protein
MTTEENGAARKPAVQRQERRKKTDPSSSAEEAANTVGMTVALSEVRVSGRALREVLRASTKTEAFRMMVLLLPGRTKRFGSSSVSREAAA